MQYQSRWVFSALAIVLAVGAARHADAHHSRAAFDTSVEVVIQGVITEVTWANPHIYFTLDAVGADGKPLQQQVEVGPLSTLGPLGLSRESLVRGERVTVRANPNRRGPGHTVVGLDVTKSDGAVYPLHVSGRARPPPAAAQATSIAGNWVPRSASFLEQLVQGSRTWPLTDAGRRGLADTASQQVSQSECVAWPAPLLMGLPMLRTIDVRPDVVTLRFDWMNAERTIHLDAQHPANVAPSRQGHSIGRWDGTTLVIDTVAFLPHREGAGFSLPSSERKHLTERLSLADNGASLDYEFTVEDPLSLTAPVTRTLQWVYRPDVKASGEQCDTEIATRFLSE